MEDEDTILDARLTITVPTIAAGVVLLVVLFTLLSPAMTGAGQKTIETDTMQRAHATDIKVHGH